MRMIDIEKLSDIEKKDFFNDFSMVEDYVKLSMSEKRFEHSKSVAETARMLAVSAKVDSDKAYLAGLLHDICKEMPKEDQFAILKEYDPDKMNYPVGAIHGYTAKYFLKNLYSDIDEEVLDAIYNHTICEHKTKLNMIIYIADKREPLRQIEDGLLEYAFIDLESAYRALVDDVEKYLKDKGNENCIRSCI